MYEPMQQVTINNTELAYAVHGAGEPVLLIHPGIVADAFAPLWMIPTLTDRYRLIHYHRRGYGKSERASSPLNMAQQAADARALLLQVGVERAHVVGHSLGGAVALQLALDAPATVQSLALLEPTLPAAMADPAAAQFVNETLGQAFAYYAAGEKAKAIDTWASGAFGPAYRAVLDRALPSAFEQAVNDADTVFQVDAPMLQQWIFTPVEARRIKQPVLSVYHHDPIWPGFEKAHELLQEWLPKLETFVLPEATHLLQIMNPQGMATALDSFFKRHGMTNR